jgi:cytochrome oxidase assembly protein ShyY1
LARPRWIVGYLLALVVVAGFVRLGVWQLDRHGEKSDLRDAVEAGQAMPVVSIELADEGSFRRVLAIGEYDGSLQTRVLRSHEGASGFHVLTPLRMPGTGILVDRGWIPLDAVVPAPPRGEVSVEGVLWPAEEGSSVPAELPEVVRRIDPQIAARFAAYPLRSDYLIFTGQADGFPTPADPPGIGLGPHLGYAGQWFLFATVVAVGYPLLLRNRARGRVG